MNASLVFPRWSTARGALLAAVLGFTVQIGDATAAEFKALVAADPSDSTRLPSTAAPAAALSKLLSLQTQMLVSKDLKEALRATRTGENQLIVGPAHVIASALSHGYGLSAVSGAAAQYALVSRTGIASVADLKTARLYLPQQDSLRSYMARALLEQAGLSLKGLQKVEYRNTSGAGLIAVGLGMADATVAEVQEAQAWIKANPGKASILSTSLEIPGGLGLVIHKSVAAQDRERITRWAVEPNSPMLGVAEFRAVTPAHEQSYGYVASLGIVTPAQLDSAKVVGAEQVRQLIAKGGVVVVDTRSPKEFAAERIAEAVLAPYGEKSLKERDYDAGLDDLSAIAKLDRNKPSIFLCNGPECWKSYKASREALKMGFKAVYWFRGGMPEWRARGLSTLRGEVVAGGDRR